MVLALSSFRESTGKLLLTDQMTQVDIVICNDTLYLMELGQMRGVGSFVSVRVFSRLLSHSV